MIEDDPRIKGALAMRAAGMTVKDVAAFYGVSGPTICRWTVPGALERDRAVSLAWKREHRDEVHAYDRAYALAARTPCAGCGQLHRPDRHLCAGCRHATAEVRASLLAGMYLDGWPLREIAEALDTTVNTIGASLVRLRAAGWDLPYRYSAQRVRAAREARAA